MKDVYIFCGTFFDFIEKRPTIGGMQTYLLDLIIVLNEIGLYPHVIVSAPSNQRVDCKDYEIIGYQTKSDDLAHELVDRFVLEFGNVQEMVLFATDGIISRSKTFEHALAIQHGICWDIPRNRKRSLLRMVCSKAYSSFRMIKRLNKISTLVCVDYNFVNWLRTQVNYIDQKIVVIPNYTHIAPHYIKPSDRISIIFARRLEIYRGTRVFTDAIIKVLHHYPQVDVTIAGDGPDEHYLREQFKAYNDRVHFIRYTSEKALEIHSDKHIAIIPSIGSEGTSLSLLEAMSAQCAVVCSNVGGMTNVVINGYNGLIIDAGNSDSLFTALDDLIEHPEKRERIAQTGYATVKQSFSYERWAQQWKKVIKENTCDSTISKT